MLRIASVRVDVCRLHAGSRCRARVAGGVNRPDARSVADPAASSEDDPALRFQVPTVTVTAQKEPEDKQKIPVSVTAVSQDTIENAGIHIVSDAAIYAPNTFFTEWTARKLSNARFRGISSSPNNPGITTYIDGVPQMNANSSSIELLDVDQIEFVRGPQSALFGRNTLGGLVNITSIRPSLTKWTGTALGAVRQPRVVGGSRRRRPDRSSPTRSASACRSRR